MKKIFLKILMFDVLLRLRANKKDKSENPFLFILEAFHMCFGP